MNNLCLIINWLILFNCYKNTLMDRETFFQGNDPNFKLFDILIEVLNPPIEKLMFSTPIYAYKDVEDIKYCMQQWLNI